jgi:DNA helicase-2/ATP-dependent DNA helicase PcrA
MTRAKASLDLLAPVKYFVTQQSRMGDRHVYGARSRFLTQQVMACLEPIAWSDESTTEQRAAHGGKVVDVAAKLRSMW